MTFMPWTDELIVGIDEIDKQHQWLVELTNQLHAQMQQKASDRDNIGQLLEQLIDYTMNHFIVEEELFDRLGYPETAAHKKQHNAFCAQVMGLLTMHDEGEMVGQQALDLLKSWLTNHIVRVDKAYVQFFRNAGIDINSQSSSNT